MKRFSFIIIAVLCISLLSTGCSTNSVQNEKIGNSEREYVNRMISENVKLNERQIDICKKEKMHTVYDQLTDSQKEAIIKIDLLLSYLENKYDKEFIYENFNLRSGNSFVVARASDDSYRRTITASMDWIDGEYVYSDTYEMEVVLSDQYKELLTQYIASILPDSDVVVDVNLNTVTDEVAAKEKVIENTDGSINILMGNVFSDEKQYTDFLNSVAEWIVNQNKNDAALYLRIFPEDCIENEEVNVINYREQYVIDDYQIRYYHCIIENQGEIRIEGPY